MIAITSRGIIIEDMLQVGNLWEEEASKGKSLWQGSSQNASPVDKQVLCVRSRGQAMKAFICSVVCEGKNRCCLTGYSKPLHPQFKTSIEYYKRLILDTQEM